MEEVLVDRRLIGAMTFISDIRFAARTLGRAPRFTIATVLPLALGLALTALILAVVNAYLIRSLPYPAADRLYHVVYASPGQLQPRGMSQIDWKSLNDVIDVADNSSVTRFYLTDGAYIQEAIGLSVASGSLDALGVRAAMGRNFVEDDFRQGAETVALISPRLWQDRFGKAADAIGRVFRASLNDQTGAASAFRIVGILPAGFQYASDMSRDIEIVTPLQAPQSVYLVRLRQGVPPDFAEQRTSEAAKSVAQSAPPNWNGIRLESVQTRYVGTIRPVLTAIAVASGLMLIIVSANIAILTLLRAARRQREVRVRFAIGAVRTQVFSMLIAENILISAMAIAAGLMLTIATLRLAAPAIERQLGRAAPGGVSSIALDPPVLFVIGGLGVLIAISLSIGPLISTSRASLLEIFRRVIRTAPDGRRMKSIRSTLVAFEIAGSLALLVGCGSMVRSALNIVRIDLGFKMDNVIRARLALPARKYPDNSALLSFYERFGETLSARMNTRLALTNWPPFYPGSLQNVEIDGATRTIESSVSAVSPDYFSVLGIAVANGRSFGRNDRIGSEPVAIVSQTLAQRLWPDENALGKRIRTGEQPAAHSRLGEWRTIVGVVRDVRQTPADTDRKDIYLPFFQLPNQYAPVFIESSRPAEFWLNALRDVAGEVDHDVLVSGVTALRDEGDRLIATTRFLTSVLVAFAVFAVMIALVGIYGVTAYAVQQREREVAIRVAVGATRTNIVRMFLKEGWTILFFGVAIGLFGAYALTSILEKQLFGLKPFDAFTVVAMSVLISLAAALAVWTPAKRAASKMPIEALKEN